MTDEEAAQTLRSFSGAWQSGKKSGELSDELDDVSGGGCYKGKRLES